MKTVVYAMLLVMVSLAYFGISLTNESLAVTILWIYATTGVSLLYLHHRSKGYRKYGRRPKK